MPSESSRFPFQRFGDFGREMRRPFRVHEICYDCGEFYEGCEAWLDTRPMKTPADRRLLCLDFLRLPDVMLGEPTGQAFPPSRMQGRKEPREMPKDSGPIPLLQSSARQCPCGADLARGKQLCDDCRLRHRRATMKAYMRRRRAESLTDATPERRKRPLGRTGAMKRPKSAPPQLSAKLLYNMTP